MTSRILDKDVRDLLPRKEGWGWGELASAGLGRRKKTRYCVGVWCLPAVLARTFSRSSEHYPSPTILSVSSGSEKGSASWQMLWGMCVSCRKLLIQWDCTVPGWNVEGFGLWVLHVWPWPSDLPDCRVCQSGVCPGKKQRHFHLHWNSSLQRDRWSHTCSFLAVKRTTKLTAHFSRHLLAQRFCGVK